MPKNHGERLEDRLIGVGNNLLEVEKVVSDGRFTHLICGTKVIELPMARVDIKPGYTVEVFPDVPSIRFYNKRGALVSESYGEH